MLSLNLNLQVKKVASICKAAHGRGGVVLARKSSSSSSSSHYANGLQFKLNANEIGQKVQDYIDSGNSFYKGLENTHSPSFHNIVKKTALYEGEQEALSNSIMFANYTSTDAAVRQASAEAMAKLQAWSIEMMSREELYKVFAKAAENEKNNTQLTAVDRRLMNQYLLEFRRSGLHLDANVRNQLKELRKKEADLQIEFQKNMNEHSEYIPFTKEELDGLPDSFFDSKKTKEENGQTYYLVTLKYPDLIPVLQLAKNENTRKKIDFINASKLMKENTPLLEETIAIRSEAAKLLGYKTHADYQLEIRMAKTTDNVMNFLTDLKTKLLPGGKQELKSLIEMKRQDCESQKKPFDGKINSWDLSFYNNKMLQSKYEVDREVVKQYFSLTEVTAAMLEIYQQLLGLRFEEVKGAEIWHEDVKLFNVQDSETNKFVGQFYLDLFPRDGKYGHAAVFPMRHHYVQADNSLSFPVAAMVANFPKPTNDRPSLLDHSDVVTYFHELGHVFHCLCSTTTYKKFSGTNVEQDFVETPSQMLENWCWEKEILQKLGKHNKTGEPLPSELIDKMIASKNLNAGLMNLRQLLFGLFDMTCHTANGKLDTAQLWEQLARDVALIETTPNTNRAASFGHIMGGYDAGYYGYLWSKVYSSDLYSVFKSKGIMNQQIGKLYRRHILAPGYEQDGMVSIKNFLGREPRLDPFLKEIGLLK